MGVVPSDIDADSQPPMVVPLRHFVVGFGFLLAAVAVGAADALHLVAGLMRAAYRHLLLAGWVCLTIMGAMTQFIPVWSGVALYSRRLAVAQLWLTAVGVAGLAAAFLTGANAVVLPAGVCLLAGIWTFVYNLGRTLARVDSPDVTEQHFALALGWFVLVTPLGVVLAAGLGLGIALPVARSQLLETHVTIAVFGAVLTTVVGALYQLATMFTQTELDRRDRLLQTYERLAYPVGVALLAAGRLTGHEPVARIGAVLVATALFGLSVVLAGRLVETRVDWTPMLSRYAVLTVALGAWALAALRAWLVAPLGRDVLLGAPGTAPLLLVGVVGFVVLGTLYHVVPFIVWIHRYSDRLGLEQVPMIDDLYDRRLARADLALFVAGLLGLLADSLTGLPAPAVLGRLCLAVGAVIFVTNLLVVLRDHGAESVASVVFGQSA